MINLKHKNILFIGTGFFDYDKSITERLKLYGANVFYFSSALTNLKKRIYIRLGKINEACKAVSKELFTLIDNQPKDIDYIFIIKADNFQEEHIDFLNKKYPNTPIVLYLWDSIKWLNNRDALLKRFKSIYTFDRLDAQRYNLKFRPLFYRQQRGSKPDTFLYDVSFVGSWHTERYSFLKKIKYQLKDNDVSYKFILRGGGFSIFVDKYITRRIDKEDGSMFITTPIPYNQYLNICMNSRVILDIANPMQSGLTIRTIEMLGMGKKLLTTNSDIIHYDFDASMYSVIDMNNPSIDIDFIKENTNREFDLSKFSLDSFLEEIFESFREG